MSEDILHQQMERYEQLTAQVSELTQERDAVARSIRTKLAGILTDAVTEQGANVEAVGQSPADHQYRFEARLDRAALVAAVTDQLPGGFVVKHVNDDGSLSIEWIGERDTPSKREHGAILKAIVAEEVVTDDDGIIESVPTVERVIERAVELDITEEDARARLNRLATLEIVDLSDGEVFPGGNFSRG